MPIEKPEISIIVPVYNGEDYLSECLDSITAQSFQDWELIIADDGSDDRTPYIADRYSDSDKRIQVLHLNRCGVSAARNSCIEAAKGDYLAFIDADDLIEQDYLERLLECAKAGNADIVQCSFMFTDGKGNRTPDPGSTDAVLTGQDEIMDAYANGPVGDIRVSVWAKLFRRELFSDIRFRTDIRIYEDALYVYRCCRKAGRVCCFKEPLYLYRQCENSVMHSLLSERYDDYFLVLEIQKEELKERRAVCRKITKREIETALWLMRIMGSEGKAGEMWKLRKKITGIRCNDLFSGTPFKLKLKLAGVIIMPHLYFALLKRRKS